MRATWIRIGASEAPTAVEQEWNMNLKLPYSRQRDRHRTQRPVSQALPISWWMDAAGIPLQPLWMDGEEIRSLRSPPVDGGSDGGGGGGNLKSHCLFRKKGYA